MIKKCIRCNAEKSRINNNWYCHRIGEYLNQVYFRYGFCPNFREGGDKIDRNVPKVPNSKRID